VQAHSSLSHSSRQDLHGCLRKYYLSTWTAHGGWAPDAAEAQRRAYRLKQPTRLDFVLGTAVHAAARDRTLAIVNSEEPKSLAETESELRAALQAALDGSADLRAFIRAPKTRPMLHSVYYSADGTPHPHEVARAAARVTPCAYHLVTSPLWNRIARLGESSILAIEDFAKFELDGVVVRLRPDLIVQDHDGSIILVDYKTGKIREQEVRSQLGLYALYVVRGLGVRFHEGTFFGWAEGLLDGQRLRYTVTGAELSALEDRLRRDIRFQEHLLTDPDANRPRSLDAFPMLPAWESAHCESECEYSELCGRAKSHVGLRAGTS
jgi:CRISPR/Cas system-associated exonuclease Cas4 (RecB family)